MIPWFRVPVLEGSLVRLEQLTFDHAGDLAVAVEEDRGSYGFTLVPRADEVGDYLAKQFERAEQGLVPFAQIRRSNGRAVGCTAPHLDLALLAAPAARRQTVVEEDVRGSGHLNRRSPGYPLARS